MSRTKCGMFSKFSFLYYTTYNISNKLKSENINNRQLSFFVQDVADFRDRITIHRTLTFHRMNNNKINNLSTLM